MKFNFEEGLIGGAAIDATGTALPDDTTAICKRADAVLLGAVGGPKWDNPSAKVRPEQGLLAIRKALGLYANLRPVAPHPSLVNASPLRPERLEGVDLLVVRELTGGIYFGEKGLDQLPGGGERARDLCTYDTEEVTRIVRMAGELARGRRGKVTTRRQGERARDVAALAAHRDQGARGGISGAPSRTSCSSIRARWCS